METTVREQGVTEDQTRVIPESIDLEVVQSRPAVDGPDVITTPAVDEHANIETMLPGLAELRDRAFQAVIIADGLKRTEYVEQAADLRIDDRVRFPGWVSLEERIAYYKRAQVSVKTAKRCPFAIELLRALACGCAAIVDYQEDSAAHELVEALDRGFRTRSREARSQAIRDVAEDDQVEYNDTYARFDHDVVSDQYRDLYHALLEDEEPGAG